MTAVGNGSPPCAARIRRWPAHHHVRERHAGLRGGAGGRRSVVRASTATLACARTTSPRSRRSGCDAGPVRFVLFDAGTRQVADQTATDDLGARRRGRAAQRPRGSRARGARRRLAHGEVVIMGAYLEAFMTLDAGDEVGRCACSLARTAGRARRGRRAGECACRARGPDTRRAPAAGRSDRDRRARSRVHAMLADLKAPERGRRRSAALEAYIARCWRRATAVVATLGLHAVWTCACPRRRRRSTATSRWRRRRRRRIPTRGTAHARAALLPGGDLLQRAIRVERPIEADNRPGRG